MSTADLLEDCPKNESLYSFTDNILNETKRIIKEDIRSLDVNSILSNFCYFNTESIIIDSRFFKIFAIPENYEIFKTCIVERIEEALSNNQKIVVHLNIQTIQIMDIEKHYDFLIKIAKFMGDKFPNKLEKCYVYSSGFIFQSIYSILSIVIDKQTRQRIIFIK